MNHRILAFAAIVAIAGWFSVSVAMAQSTLAVVVNKDVPIEKVDAGQATQLFLRQVTTWSDGVRVQPVDLTQGNPLRAEFYSRITGRSPGQLRAYWARQAFTGMGVPLREVATVEDVSRFILSTPGAIGYVERRNIDTGLKIVLEAAP
jgi:ABC-type phosphate transport system substrate-binding protein